MTIGDVVASLRLGRTTIYALIARGELDALKIGAATRITRASVERLIERATALQKQSKAEER